MTREFSDELLSAYLDGEVSREERALVEQRLTESAADRQLLEELKKLREAVALLPAAQPDAGFADRVLQAAVQAKADRDVTPAALAASAAPAAGRNAFVGRGWAAVAAAIVAAALLLVVRPWQFGDIVQNNPPQAILPGPGPTLQASDGGQRSGDQLTAAGPLMAALGGVAPAANEAVVLRLRLRADVPVAASIDAALAAAGIGQRPASDTSSGAAELGAAYRRQVQVALAGAEAAAAVDAIYIEAPLAQLDEVLATLTHEAGQKLAVASETRLALVRRTGDSADNRGADGEGEGGSGANASSGAAAGQAFAQRLNAGMFRLPQREMGAPATSSTGDPSAIAGAALRVLILVEREAPLGDGAGP